MLPGDSGYAALVKGDAGEDGAGFGDLRSLAAEKAQAERPKRPLLILDLDETLWQGTESPLSFQLRPHLSEFLRTVNQSYDLAVWTSATSDWMRSGLEAVRQETGFVKRPVYSVINPEKHRIANSTSGTLFIPTPSSRVSQLFHN